MLRCSGVKTGIVTENLFKLMIHISYPHVKTLVAYEDVGLK